MSVAARLRSLEDQLEQKELALDGLDARLSKLEQGVALLGAGNRERMQQAVDARAEAMAHEAVTTIRAAGARATSHAAAVNAALRPEKIVVSAEILAPVSEELEQLIELANEVESIIDAMGGGLEAAVTDLIARGDAVVAEATGRVTALLDDAAELVDATNGEVFEVIETGAPEELEKGLSALHEFLSAAEGAVGEISKLLDGSLGEANEYVGTVTDIVEPVLPALESMEALS